MFKRMHYPHLLLVLVLVLLAIPVIVLAQGGTPPPSFNDALADLGRRLGRTITLADFDNSTSRWEWRGVEFVDNTLECPNPGEVVTPGKVIGYQYIFILRGRKYDYRVAFNDPKTLRLCTNPTGQIYEPTAPPRATANAEPPSSLNDALVDLNKRTGLNLTLDDFNNPRSRYAWRFREFRNSQLDCPSPGQAVDQVITQGWQFTFVYNRATYDYRVKLNDPSSLFLCFGPATPPARYVTATPRP